MYTQIQKSKVGIVNGAMALRGLICASYRINNNKGPKNFSAVYVN